MPYAIRDDVIAYVGCIAGAIGLSEYETGLRRVGFDAVAVIDAGADLNAYSMVEGQSACCSPVANSSASACCSPSSTGIEAKGQVHAHLATLLTRFDVNDYAASVKVFAVKPTAPTA